MIVITRATTDEALCRNFEITLNGTPADALGVRVSAIPFNTLWPGHQRPLDQTESAAYISYAADEPVEVCVRVSHSVTSAVVRPLSEGVLPTICDGVISFTLPHEGQYVLEFDGPHGALHIFADPIKEYAPLANCARVIRFGPGEHRVGQIELEDHTTVLIDRSAVVHGSFLAVGAEDIAILGEGVIDGGWDEREDDHFLLVYDFSRCPATSWEHAQMAMRFKGKDLFPQKPEPGMGSFLYRNRQQFQQFINVMKPVKSGLHFYACKNVRVEGITLRDCCGLSVTAAGCEQVHFDRVKLIGMWRYNSDGIDFYNCKYCSVKNSFLRTFDDSICMKGQIGWDTMNTEDITVENVVVWNDWGHSLEFGADSVATEIKNIVFRDCDIIHHSNTVMDIKNMDRAHVHDVLFDDIRVEYSCHDLSPVYQKNEAMCYEPTHHLSHLIGLQVLDSTWSDDGILGRNSDVTFRNIKVLSDEGLPFPKISITGYDKEHTTSRVLIENVSHNGNRLTVKEMNLHLGEHVSDITVK